MADGCSKMFRRDFELPEPTRKEGTNQKGAKISVENIQGESGEPQPTKSKDDADARAGFWSIQGDFIYRLHNEPRVQLYVPEEETFPFPLKYMDVTRFTHADLDVLQEKRFDDYWNVDSSRSLSDSWKGFTKFTLLKEKPPKGYMVFGWRLTKIQTTTRADHVWPEVWTKVGEAAQNREKQERKNEKPKLDNARSLRGIYFTDPDDQEYKEILERLMAPAMLWKRPPNSITKVAAKPKIEPENYQKKKQRTAVQWNLMNPPGNVWNLPSPKNHEDHIAGKRICLRCLITIWCTSATRCLKR